MNFFCHLSLPCEEKKEYSKKENQPKIGFKSPFVTLDKKMHNYKLGYVNSKKKKHIKKKKINPRLDLNGHL